MTKGLSRSISRGSRSRAPIIKQTIPVKNLAIAVAGTTGVGFGSAVLGDFPQGNILLLGVVAYLQFNNQADADVQAAFDGDYSIGTTATADVTLSGTDIDIVPSTALGAATAGISPIARGVQAAQAMFDNTDDSLELNLNLLIDDANISGAATFLANGTVQVAYIVMGDD